TSTLLILGVVALFGILNVLNTSKVFDDQAKAQQKSYAESLQKRGSVQTKDLVQASRTAIVQNDFTTLQSFVPDIAQGDPEVAYVYVVDREGTVLAHSDKALNGRPMTDPLSKDILASKDAVTREV